MEPRAGEHHRDQSHSNDSSIDNFNARVDLLMGHNSFQNDLNFFS